MSVLQGSEFRCKSPIQEVWFIQPQYYFVLRTNTVLCGWRLVPTQLHLPCSTCQNFGIDHRTVPVNTPGRHTVMLTGLLIPWTILFAQRHTMSRILRSALQYAEISVLLEVARMGLLLFCQGVKFHCLGYLLCGQTWTAAFGYPMFSSHQKCCFKHMPAYFNEHPSYNYFKFMVSSHEILKWPLQRKIFAVIFCILNMPRSSYFWRSI